MKYNDLYCGVWDFKGEIRGISAFRCDKNEDAPVPVTITGGQYGGQCNMALTGKDILVSVTEVGKDGMIISYRIAEDGSLTQLDALHTESAKLSYICADPDNCYVYVSSMGDATVKMIRVFTNGRLRERAIYPTMDPSGPQDGQCADIIVSSDGKYVYVSNRGQDTIAVFHTAGVIANVPMAACVRAR